MGRDHSCYLCGNGGMNDPEGVCTCMAEEAALRLLSDGFASWEVHPACLRFFTPEGALTYWKGDDMGGDNWTFEPVGALGQAVTKENHVE